MGGGGGGGAPARPGRRSAAARRTHLRARSLFSRAFSRARSLPANLRSREQVLVKLTHDKRRLAFPLTIGNGDDMAKARRVIVEALRGTEGVLADPPPEALPFFLTGGVFGPPEGPASALLCDIDITVRGPVIIHGGGRSHCRLVSAEGRTQRLDLARELHVDFLLHKVL